MRKGGIVVGVEIVYVCGVCVVCVCVCVEREREREEKKSRREEEKKSRREEEQREREDKGRVQLEEGSEHPRPILITQLAAAVVFVFQGFHYIISPSVRSRNQMTWKLSPHQKLPRR